MLKDFHRILKPGGHVYVGIENRIGYVYFLGGRDHGGLRFTSLMPRPIADIYSRLIKRQPYRAYTYSLLGYKNLLKKAGYSQIDFYATIPSYRNVFFLVVLMSTAL